MWVACVVGRKFSQNARQTVTQASWHSPCVQSESSLEFAYAVNPAHMRNILNRHAASHTHVISTPTDACCCRGRRLSTTCTSLLLPNYAAPTTAHYRDDPRRLQTLARCRMPRSIQAHPSRMEPHPRACKGINACPTRHNQHELLRFSRCINSGYMSGCMREGTGHGAKRTGIGQGRNLGSLASGSIGRVLGKHRPSQR